MMLTGTCLLSMSSFGQKLLALGRWLSGLMYKYISNLKEYGVSLLRGGLSIKVAAKTVLTFNYVYKVSYLPKTVVVERCAVS